MSAAALAAAEGSAVVAAVSAVFDALDPLPSPNNPVASVLPSVVPFKPPFAPAVPPAIIAAPAAAPLANACCGTTPWPLASAAKAACKASSVAFESVALVFLPGVPLVVPSVTAPAKVSGRSAAAVVGSGTVGVVAAFASACA